MMMVLIIVVAALAISVLSGALIGPKRGSSGQPGPWLPD